MTDRASQRIEDEPLLRGAARFVDDLVLPGMLHLQVVRSTHAHARIKSVDLSSARNQPGVVDVFCARTIGMELPHIPIRLLPMDVAEKSLQRPLARDTVRYVGEPVAVVVARTRELAQDAAEQIDVEYEPLRPTMLSEDALAQGGPHSVAVDYTVARGHAEEAFQEADYVRALHFSTGRLTAVPCETRGILASWKNGKLELHGLTKVPFFNRTHLSRAFGIETNAVSIRATAVGGSFGVRGELYPEDYLAVAASRRTGKPVKWVEQRSEHFMATNQSRQIDCELEIAAQSDGRVIGLRANLIADLGAYVRTNGIVVAAKAAQFLPGPYRIAAFEARVQAALTHKTPVGTYRGPGRSEANFMRERMIDVMCADLSLDRFETRALNLVRPDDMPFATGDLVPGEAGAAYDNGDYPAALHRLESLTEAGNVAHEPSGPEVVRGFGLACFNDSSGGGRFEQAKLSVGSLGRFTVALGSTEFGQGLVTTIAPLCSEKLQVSIEDVTVCLGDTSQLGDGVGSFHGRSAFMGGSAAVQGCANLIEAGKVQAGLRLNAPAASISYANGQFFVEGDPRSFVTWSDLAAGAPLIAEARFEQPQLTFSYGAHAALVEVDVGTGEVRVLKYWAVEDFGTVLNPELVHGLVVGGIAQGLGDVLQAQIVYDETSGQLLTGSLMDYALPRAGDIPPMELELLSGHPSDKNPLGVKGAGEGGIAGVAAAVGNAVADAVGRADVVLSTPITPQLLAAALRTACARPR